MSLEGTFKALDIQLTDFGINTNKTDLLVVNNPDGTPRWIINSGSKKPLFLKFYSATTFRSKVYANFIKLVFFSGLHKRLFKTYRYSFEHTDGNIAPVIDPNKSNWAIFTGTVGPNNKILVYEEELAKNFFYKVATTQNAKKLIDNEESTIRHINSLKPDNFKAPEIKKINSHTLKQEDISMMGQRSLEFSLQHASILSEIYSKTRSDVDVFSLPIISETIDKLNDLKETKDKRLPNGLIKKLDWLLNSVENGCITTGLSHGDFTPWNMYINKSKPAVYDWELARQQIPVGYDAFHFIIQKGILVDRKPWKAIKNEIDEKITIDLLSEWCTTDNAKVESYLKLYLLINTVQHLHLYARQENWHMQVAWLINTWDHAISESLSKSEQNRELLILDTFTYLNNKTYAAIKFPDTSPEKLSVYSDIDLCIRKDEYNLLLDNLINHPLVKHIRILRKSFMASLQIFLVDNSLLNLDLIWKFKRKSLVTLNADEIMANFYRNPYGIKQISKSNLRRYIGLFYGLNNAEIPEKFNDDVQVLKSITPIDDLIFTSKFQKLEKAKRLRKLLMKEKENQHIKRIFNILNYMSDTLKHILFSKGITITFSGVDGAGKSTVIENIKYEIEKKNRKRVIVLRHRPSLLPILSAWTKGKENAEKIAANTLPRQGSNKSALSSFLRFCYYYADYLFGQFYVYFRYIIQGYVVLYDRYYFDFINDSRRSNIRLPKNITRAGYALLRKPDLNFFLYADPETILARKQELDKTTITSLTDDYLQLFDGLNASANKRYFSVKNIELDQTIEFIMNKTSPKLAHAS